MENAIDFIPHRPPFVMVDKALEVTPEKSITSFIIKPDNYLTKDNYFTESGLIENIAQSVALTRGINGSKLNQAPIIGFIASIKNLVIYDLPMVNTEIQTTVHFTSQFANFTTVQGLTTSNGKPLASCELIIAIQN